MAKIDVFTITQSSNDLPSNPYSCIWLVESMKDAEGRTLLSPQLMNNKEIDESVNFLIEQLEKVRKKVKKELQKR